MAKEKSRVLEMLETGKTVTWPVTASEAKGEGFVAKEVQGKPSTERSQRLFDRYLNAKCRFDGQMPLLYTKAWKENAGQPLYIRRGLAYKYMIENMDATVKEDEVIVGSKTRFERGATMYPQFATKFMIDFLDMAEDEEAKLFSVSGDDEAHNINEEGWVKLGQLFSIREEEVEPMKECLQYWSTRSVEDVSEQVMESAFPEYEDYVLAKKVGLFPGSGLASGCDGRWVPAYDIIVERGLEDVIAECERHLAESQPIKKDGTEKIFFWKACIYTCEAIITWAKHYAEDARRQAETAAEPRKSELLQMAEALEWVPAKPARTFREGLQAAWC